MDPTRTQENTTAARSHTDRSAAPNKLSKRQAQILDFIKVAVARNGYPPSVREIGDAVGLASPSSVAHQLRALEERGLLRRDPNRPRALEIKTQRASGGSHTPDRPLRDQFRGAEASVTIDEQAAYVPLVGRIAAGAPVLADQVVEQILPLPRDLVGNGELFSLRVVGDSMIDAAICDGDLVVIRRQADARPGDIVAALFEDEATVKRFKRDGDRVWLMPANPAYSPIPAEDARILGKVVTVLRRL